jgi:hypothetical protein
MYIKSLPIPNLMQMHGKLLNTLKINDLIRPFLYTCVHVHVCILYMYMYIIWIIFKNMFTLYSFELYLFGQMESIIKSVLHSWNPNIILNHNANNVQLMCCTCIYDLIHVMYMYSENNYCYINKFIIVLFLFST